MPGKRAMKPTERGRWNGAFNLAVLTVCFVCGSVCGFIFALLREPSSALCACLREYLSAEQAGPDVSFFRVFWDCFRWPAAVLLFGTTLFGVVAIPGLFLIRGFILSYTAASFGALLGQDGVLVAMILFAVTVVLLLPLLFLLGGEGLHQAVLRYREPGTVGHRWRPELLLSGAGVLIVASALQYTVVPMLLSAVSSRLFY